MKKKIALLTGGYSGEAAISYKSAVTFYNNLKNRFDVFKIDITPNGWFYENEKGNRFEIDKNDFSLLINSKKISFEVIFIGIHGTPGEDGKLQGYFDLLGCCTWRESTTGFSTLSQTSIIWPGRIRTLKPSSVLDKGLCL